MKSRLIEEQPRIYVLVFETGDEVASKLKQFATEQQNHQKHCRSSMIRCRAWH